MARSAVALLAPETMRWRWGTVRSGRARTRAWNIVDWTREVLLSSVWKIAPMSFGSSCSPRRRSPKARTIDSW